MWNVSAWKDYRELSTNALPLQMRNKNPERGVDQPRGHSKSGSRESMNLQTQGSGFLHFTLLPVPRRCNLCYYWDVLEHLAQCLEQSECSINADRLGYRKVGRIPRRSKGSLCLQLKSITPIGMTDLTLSSSSHWKSSWGKKVGLHVSAKMLCAPRNGKVNSGSIVSKRIYQPAQQKLPGWG